MVAPAREEIDRRRKLWKDWMGVVEEGGGLWCAR